MKRERVQRMVGNGMVGFKVELISRVGGQEDGHDAMR
jgi:hypothetical protein